MGTFCTENRQTSPTKLLIRTSGANVNDVFLRRSIDAEMRKVRLSWGETKKKEEDRDDRRTVVKNLCPPLGEKDY